jgi:protein subunit release factor B
MKTLSEKEQLGLDARMRRLHIDESDIMEKFILGSGKGGQKINKTSSCVYLRHIPSGFEIKCQSSRSREVNRYQARLRLCQQLEEKAAQEHLEKQQIAEKIRRQKRRPTKQQKEKMIEQKRHRSTIKSKRSQKLNTEGD